MGYAATALRISDSPQRQLCIAGPRAHPISSGGWIRSYFDQPFDAWAVLFGIYLYDLYGTDLGGLDEAALSRALEQFIKEKGEPPDL